MTIFLLVLALLVPQGKPKQATIVVAPGTVTIPVGGSQQFVAVTTGTTKLPVWSATGGSITQAGRFVAGLVPGTYIVTATLPGNVKNAAIVSITPSMDTTPPTVPTNLTITLKTQTSFDLGWNPSTDDFGVKGYDIYVPANGPLVNMVVGAGASFAGLLCNTTMTVGVSAFDTAGNHSAQAIISVTTLACIIPPDTTPPLPPTGFAITPQQTTAALAWQASPSTDVVAYRVWLQGVLKQTVTGTLATISGLLCNTSYIMAVDAVDLAGNPSVKVSLTVPTLACTVITTPTTLKFVAPTDYATNVTSCNVELRLGGAAPLSPPVATRGLGKPAIVSGEISVDISTLVDPLPAGTYYAVVACTGPGGTTYNGYPTCTGCQIAATTFTK